MIEFKSQMEGLRRCKGPCGQEKPVGDFYIKRSEGVQRITALCKVCLKQATLRRLNKPVLEKKCPICRKKFMAKPGTDGRYRKTCTSECAGKLRRKNYGKSGGKGNAPKMLKLGCPWEEGVIAPQQRAVAIW